LKEYSRQVLRAVHAAHARCVMHRDLKPQNVLVDRARGIVKVADFGLARGFLPPHKPYTDRVVTLWYRAPELLLGARAYGPAVDVWSVGCIVAEMLNREPLFRAESEVGMLHHIFQALGTPDDESGAQQQHVQGGAAAGGGGPGGSAHWRGVRDLAHWRPDFPKWRPRDMADLLPALRGDAVGLDLLSRLLCLDPSRRLTAGQALAHAWFDELRGADEDGTGGGGGGGDDAVMLGAQQQQQQQMQQQPQQQQHAAPPLPPRPQAPPPQPQPGHPLQQQQQQQAGAHWARAFGGGGAAAATTAAPPPPPARQMPPPQQTPPPPPPPPRG
jgi:serine/threonine protein kinase